MPLKGHSIFISAQLSSDAVSALRKVPVLIIMTVLRSNLEPKHARKHETHPPRVKKKKKKKESSISIQTIVVLFVLVQTLLAAINDTPCFI